MADWEEIKRLAADFQRTQTSDTLQRIPERNCIDIVKKLTDLGLIELIYTCDGKEFLTPDHLLKEIQDETYMNGGRVHLHDLASTLNVDYQHIENKAKELAKERSDEYSLVLGQIIHSNYRETLGKQINDIMITEGELSIAEFAKALDLPSEFLLSIVKELLPQIMEDYVASPDERTYYSSDMMDRYKAIISGTLSAIKKPTTVASIVKRLDIPERLFTPILNGLIKDGRVDAVVESSVYTPSVYAREQNEWVDKFYQSNSYIDYDVLARKNIKQPKAFLKKRFPEGKQLKNCFVSPNFISQIESMVEECIASDGLIDIATVVPGSFQSEDIDLILQDLFKTNKQFSSSSYILNQTNVCSLGFIDSCKKTFSAKMTERAKEHLKQGKLVTHFLSGNQDKLKQKAEESSQSSQQPASASKTPRSNKGRAAKRAEAYQEPVKKTLEFMSTSELIQGILRESEESGDFEEEMFEPVAQMMYDSLNREYEKLAREILDEHLRDQKDKQIDEVDVVEDEPSEAKKDNDEDGNKSSESQEINRGNDDEGDME